MKEADTIHEVIRMRIKRYACNRCGAEISSGEQSKVIFQTNRARKTTTYVCGSCCESLIREANKSRRASILAIVSSAGSDKIVGKTTAVAR
jgi:hypothetical protein